MRAPETEFEDLEALLREDRPAPDPRWTRGLDAKMAAGFPSRRRRWPSLPALGLNHVVAVAACGLLAVVIGAAALTAGGGDDFGASGGSGGAQSAAESDAAPDPSGGSSGASAGGSSGGAAASGGASAGETQRGAGLQEASRDAKGVPSTATLAPAPPPPGEVRAESRARRYVEQSAQLSLATRPRDVDKVASGVARTATELGGYVAASSVSSQAGGTLELRIPSDRLDRGIARLSELAEVRDLTRASTDITAGVVSAKSRLRDARTERSSLLRQLALADTVNETASIRARLRIVSRQIERLKADVRRTTNRAAFASVGVELHADRGVGAAARDDDSWTPGDAARDAVRVLEVALGVGLIALAIGVPAGLIALLALAAARILTRRRRERALDLA